MNSNWPQTGRRRSSIRLRPKKTHSRQLDKSRDSRFLEEALFALGGASRAGRLLTHAGHNVNRLTTRRRSPDYCSSWARVASKKEGEKERGGGRGQIELVGPKPGEGKTIAYLGRELLLGESAMRPPSRNWSAQISRQRLWRPAGLVVGHCTN